MISLTSQSKQGKAKYKTRKEGTANTTVIRMYMAKMAALAGMAYKTIKRNMTIKGNLAVTCKRKIKDLRSDDLSLSTLK